MPDIQKRTLIMLGWIENQTEAKRSPVTECPEPASAAEENDEEGVEYGAKDEGEAGEELQ